MLDVKLLPCKEIRAWRKGKDELCDANAMVKCDIRIENQSSDAKFRKYIELPRIMAYLMLCRK